MTYNIHPLVVHFPIAFLLLYSLFKIFPFERWIPKISWRQVRFILLLAGVLGAVVASMTGEVAEHLVRPDRSIVEMHSLFAAVSTWIYAALLAGELLAFLNPYFAQKFSQVRLLKVSLLIERILTHRALSIFLSIVGVIAISLTGLLGGFMVYGASADPFATLILGMLGIQ